jgi:GT2 family glycosyltransferase
MTISSAKATVIIPNWNGGQWLPLCFKGLSEQEFKDFSVILVDNGSKDNSVDFVQKNYPLTTIISFPENKGFAAAVNAGIQKASSEFIVLLNSDTYPRPAWLANLIRALEKSPSSMGGVASKMLKMENPDIIENAGDMLSWQGAATKRGHGFPSANYHEMSEVLSVCAGAALYRKSFLTQTQGFDEHFFAYLEDVDLGLRGRHLGYKYLLAHDAEVLHQGHGSKLPQSHYVKLMTRNRLLLLFKNIPCRLFIKHFLSFLYGQFYFLIAYRKPWHSILGYLSFLSQIPYVIRERQNVLKNSRLSQNEIENLLVKKMPEPPLIKSLVNKLRKSGK